MGELKEYSLLIKVVIENQPFNRVKLLDFPWFKLRDVKATTTFFFSYFYVFLILAAINICIQFEHQNYTKFTIHVISSLSLSTKIQYITFKSYPKNRMLISKP